MISRDEITSLARELSNGVATRGELDNLRSSLDLLEEFLEEEQLDRIAMSINYSDEQKIKLLRNSLARFTADAGGLIIVLFEKLLVEKYFELFNPDNFNFLADQILTLASRFKKVKISLAVELEQQDYLLVKDKLKRRFSEDIILDVAIKPNLIGGFILQYDSVIIDASIEKSLEEYRHEWVASFNNRR